MAKRRIKLEALDGQGAPYIEIDSGESGDIQIELHGQTESGEWVTSRAQLLSLHGGGGRQPESYKTIASLLRD